MFFDIEGFRNDTGCNETQALDTINSFLSDPRPKIYYFVEAWKKKDIPNHISDYLYIDWQPNYIPITKEATDILDAYYEWKKNSAICVNVIKIEKIESPVIRRLKLSYEDGTIDHISFNSQFR